MSTAALLAKLRRLRTYGDDTLTIADFDVILTALESVDRLTRERDEARGWARTLRKHRPVLTATERQERLCAEFDALDWAHEEEG